MKTQHTPGPWRLAYQENGKLEMGGSTTHYTGVYSSVGFGIIAEVIYKITNILGDSKILEYQTFEANAKLIAAAPELLEALKDVAATKSLIMKRSPSELELQEILKTFERVNEAIKKAE